MRDKCFCFAFHSKNQYVFNKNKRTLFPFRGQKTPSKPSGQRGGTMDSVEEQFNWCYLGNTQQFAKLTLNHETFINPFFHAWGIVGRTI